MTQLLTNIAIRSDWLLERLFNRAARGLPLAVLALAARRPPRGAAVHLVKTDYGHSPVHLSQDRSARRSEGRSGH